MKNKSDICEYLLAALKREYALQKNDIGADSLLKKRGMTFETESYEVAGFGHFCILRMKAFFGLMKMETAVLAPFEADVPLFNLDRVRAVGKETLIAELYDTQIEPWPPEKQAEFDRIREWDSDLPEKKQEAHWYDGLLYSCSYHKQGKKLTARFDRTAQAYVNTYLSQLASAPRCERGEKTAKNAAFARTLTEKGGPAVDTITKLFGKETAERLILTHMYGVETEKGENAE